MSLMKPKPQLAAFSLQTVADAKFVSIKRPESLLIISKVLISLYLYQILKSHENETVTWYPALIQLPARMSPKMIHCIPAESSFINCEVMNFFVGTSRERYKEAVFPWEHCYTSGFGFLKITSYETSQFFGILDAEHLRPSRLTLRRSKYNFTLFQQVFSLFILYGKIYLTKSLFSSYVVLQFKHKYFQIFIHIVKKILTWHSFLCIFRLTLRCFSCLLTMKLHLEPNRNLKFKRIYFFPN